MRIPGALRRIGAWLRQWRQGVPADVERRPAIECPVERMEDGLLLDANEEGFEAEIERLRDRLVRNEFAEEVESQRSDSLRIVRQGDMVPLQRQRRSFREDGLQAQSDRFVVRSAEGLLVPADRIVGVCEDCGGFAACLLFCTACRKPLCARHAFDFRGATYCERHWQIAWLDEDAWGP